MASLYNNNRNVLMNIMNNLRKCISAHDRRKSNRKEQHGERGMTASLFTKLYRENTFLTLTKIFSFVILRENSYYQ